MAKDKFPRIIFFRADEIEFAMAGMFVAGIITGAFMVILLSWLYGYS